MPVQNLLPVRNPVRHPNRGLQVDPHRLLQPAQTGRELIDPVGLSKRIAHRSSPPQEITKTCIVSRYRQPSIIIWSAVITVNRLRQPTIIIVFGRVSFLVDEVQSSVFFHRSHCTTNRLIQQSPTRVETGCYSYCTTNRLIQPSPTRVQTGCDSHCTTNRL